MSSFREKSWLISGYRREFSAAGEPRRNSKRHLRAAADALHIALLNLDIRSHQQRFRELEHQLSLARNLLVDAVSGLSRARVYNPEIRTFTVDVILASEADLHLEQVRIRQLATQLLWYNHRFLPIRRRAQVLRPEEEVQLARVVQNLTWQAKLTRFFDYKGLTVASLFACVGAWMVGWGILALGFIASSLTLLVCYLFTLLRRTAKVPIT